ncbi:MAG: hypothetical protein LBB18_02690 [Puniceicoccales bacterium]|nr:hypothetical protein [Puniceicoccales bacterium]
MTTKAFILHFHPMSGVFGRDVVDENRTGSENACCNTSKLVAPGDNFDQLKNVLANETSDKITLSTRCTRPSVPPPPPRIAPTPPPPRIDQTIAPISFAPSQIPETDFKNLGSISAIAARLSEVNKEICNLSGTLGAMAKIPELADKKFQLETNLRNAEAFSGRSIMRIFELAKSAAIMAKKSVNDTAAIFDGCIERLRNKLGNIDLEKIYGEKEFKKMCKIARNEFYNACKLARVQKKIADEIINIDAINADSSAWQTCTNRAIVLSRNGTTSEVVCKDTPLLYKVDDKPPDRGGTSNNRNSAHLVNARTIEVTNADGKLIFSSARHGCIRGQDQATIELITAAARSRLNDINVLNVESSMANPIPLHISNIQLMTPGAFACDKKFPFKQMEHIRKYIGRVISINVPDSNAGEGFRKMYVKLEEPLLFNFGCNWENFSAISMFFTSSDRENRKSMVRLFGADTIDGGKRTKVSALQKFYTETINAHPNEIDFKKAADLFSFSDVPVVARYLRGNETPRNKKIVLQLAAQIVKIWRDGAHKNNPSNPYAIQERLAILSYMLGYCMSINCKSGKDRTGMMCASTAVLATEIAMSSDNPVVPDPYKSNGKDEYAVLKANNSTMVNATNAARIAADCTGYLGMKVADNGRSFNVKKRFGTVTGASRFSKS